MSSPTLVDRVAHITTRLLVRDGAVVAIRDLSDHLRRIDLAVAGHPTWAPGQKVQVRVRGFDFRTYTPCLWTPDRVSLVAHTGATTGPAQAWLDELAVGDAVEMFGPRGAATLPAETGSTILVGDETSIAMAAAIHHHGPTLSAQLYEVTDAADTERSLEALELPGASLVERAADGTHLSDLGDLVVQAVTAEPTATLVLTGRARTIADVRRRLRDEDLRPRSVVKAHWDERRKGMD